MNIYEKFFRLSDSFSVVIKNQLRHSVARACDHTLWWTHFFAYRRSRLHLVPRYDIMFWRWSYNARNAFHPLLVPLLHHRSALFLSRKLFNIKTNFTVCCRRLQRKLETVAEFRSNSKCIENDILMFFLHCSNFHSSQNVWNSIFAWF